MATTKPQIHALLIEDEPEAAELVKISLSQSGEFSLEWAPSLLEGMKRLVRPGVDVIILDLGMPELSGYKTHRAIEAVTGRKIPVVILTGDERRVSRDATLESGAIHYFVKGQTSPVELRRVLRQAVADFKP